MASFMFQRLKISSGYENKFPVSTKDNLSLQKLIGGSSADVDSGNRLPG